jgi:hypothetical protein
LLLIFCPSFFAALIPVTVSAKTTKIVKIRKPLIGIKNEAIKPQHKEKEINSQD